MLTTTDAIVAPVSFSVPELGLIHVTATGYLRIPASDRNEDISCAIVTLIGTGTFRHQSSVQIISVPAAASISRFPVSLQLVEGVAAGGQTRGVTCRRSGGSVAITPELYRTTVVVTYFRAETP